MALKQYVQEKKRGQVTKLGFYDPAKQRVYQKVRQSNVQKWDVYDPIYQKVVWGASGRASSLKKIGHVPAKQRYYDPGTGAEIPRGESVPEGATPKFDETRQEIFEKKQIKAQEFRTARQKQLKGEMFVEVSREVPERKSFARSSFEKLGYTVEESDSGRITAVRTKDGKTEKVTLDKEGFAITPEKAKVQTRFIPAVEQRKEKERLKSFGQKSFEKLGYKVTESGGILTATKGTEKVIIGAEGSTITPTSAKVLTNFIPANEVRKQAEKERKERIARPILQRLAELRYELVKRGEVVSGETSFRPKVRRSEKDLKEILLGKDGELKESIKEHFRPGSAPGLDEQPKPIDVVITLKDVKKFVTKLKEIDIKTPAKKFITHLKEFRYGEKEAKEVLVGYQPTKEELIKSLKGAPALIGLGVARAGVGIVEAAVRPDIFVKEQVGVITNKKMRTEALKTIKQQIKRDPTGLFIEFVTFERGLKLAGYGVKRSPVGRSLSRELYLMQQPLEVRSFLRAILKAESSQKKLNPYNIKDVTVKRLNAQTLTAIELKAVLKTVKETKSVIFGSGASSVLSKGKLSKVHDLDIAVSDVAKFNVALKKNLPKDVVGQYSIRGQKFYRGKNELLDVKPFARLRPGTTRVTRFFGMTGSLPVSGIRRISKAISKLKTKAQIKGEISRIKDYLGSVTTETSTKRSILKAKLDLVKLNNKLTTLKFKVSDIPKTKKGATLKDLGVLTEKTVTVDGIKFVSFSEQTKRKGLGTIQVLLEKEIKRQKDPAAFITHLEVQLKGLKAKRYKTPFGEFNRKRKIKVLTDSLKILKTMKFQKLLESKVPGITKTYPIEGKLFREPKIKEIKNGDIPLFKGKKDISNKHIKEAKITPTRVMVRSKFPRITSSHISELSKIPSKISKLPSKISKLPSRIKSKLSKVPSSKISKLPSKIQSKLPSRISKLPSKISKLPSKIQSKLPSRISKLHSKLSKLSKLPSKIPSKLSKISIKVIIPQKTTKTYKIKSQTKKIGTKKKTGTSSQFTDFTHTIDDPAKAIRRSEQMKLYTGAELR